MPTKNDPVPPKDCTCGALWTVRGEHGKFDCPFRDDPIEERTLEEKIVGLLSEYSARIDFVIVDGSKPTDAIVPKFIEVLQQHGIPTPEKETK